MTDEPINLSMAFRAKRKVIENRAYRKSKLTYYTYCVRIPNDTAWKLFEKARELGVSYNELINLFIEDGLKS